MVCQNLATRSFHLGEEESGDTAWSRNTNNWIPPMCLGLRTAARSMVGCISKKPMITVRANRWDNECPYFHHPAVPAIPYPLTSTLMAAETHRHVHFLYKVDTGSPALRKHSDASAAGEHMHCGTQLWRRCWLLCHTWLLLWELRSLPWNLAASFVSGWKVGRLEVLPVPAVDCYNWPWVNKPKLLSRSIE